MCVEVCTVQQCKTGGTGTDGQQTAKGGRETEPTSYLKLSFKVGGRFVFNTVHQQQPPPVPI